MRKNWSVAYLLFQCVFFSGLLNLGEKLAHASNVLPTVRGLSDRANCSHAYNRGQMKDAVHAYDSGLEGTTHSKVVSGVPGGPTTGGPASIEFAIAPIENDRPSYNKAIFVRSDEEGKYKVSLPSGKYWLGPKAKALDPINYAPGSFSVSEEIVVVEQGTFTKIDVFQVGYAP